MLTHIALAIDAFLLAYAVGTTVWFFFVQGPALIKWMGRERFIPIQMRLTRVFFQSLAVATPLMLGATFIHGRDQFWLHVATVGLATIGVLVNTFIILPRALRAGGRSLREMEGEDSDGSVAKFASEGAGEPSKFWHRMVVLFVVVMLAGLVSHGAVLLGGVAGDESASCAPARVHQHAAEFDAAPKFRANAETTAGVRAMQSIVAEAASQSEPTAELSRSAARELKTVYEGIFRDCTMTGEAHEQLHSFLLPVGERLSRLEQSEGRASGDVLRELQAHLESYDSYFE